jgi:hypothetical protein
MKPKRKNIAAIVLLAAVICCVATWIYFGIYGHSGTAANTQALAHVYRANDPNLAAFYANAFIHKVRFTAPIRWHRAVWRPSVSLTSQVDVVAFRRDMSDEQFVDLHPEWVSQGTTTVHYFKVLHRLPDDWMVKTEGTLDVSSGAFGMESRTFFSKIDDHWWHKLTNGGRIDFTFDVKSK